MDIIPVTEDNFDAYLAMAAEAWDLRLEPEVARWRFLQPPRHSILGGFEQGKCLAALSAFEKTYSINGENISFLETYDWYTLPEARGRRLGTKLREEMMTWGLAMISVGGSSATRALLPEMGYQVVNPGGKFGLRLAGYRFGSLPRAMGISKAAELLYGAYRGFRLALDRGHSPKKYQWNHDAGVGDEVLSLYDRADDYAMYQVPDPALYNWLTRQPEFTGQYAVTVCSLDGRPCGWFLLRIFQNAGQTRARLIEMFSPARDAGLYSAMVWQAVRRTQQLGAGYLEATTTSRVLSQALLANHFKQFDTAPLMIWGAPWVDPEQETHLTANRADAVFMPLQVPESR